MRKAINLWTVIFFMTISNNASFCQATDTPILYSDVEYVLKKANHGFRWWPEQTEIKLMYEKIIKNHLEYNTTFENLMNKYLIEKNHLLTSRLVGLLIETDDSTYFDILGRMLWAIEDEFIPLVGSDTLNKSGYNKSREKTRHLQNVIINYLSKKNYKKNEIKDFCFLMIENKENSSLFRACLKYLSVCYSNDLVILKRIDKILVGKRFYDSTSLKMYYHELFRN